MSKAFTVKQCQLVLHAIKVARNRQYELLHAEVDSRKAKKLHDRIGELTIAYHKLVSLRDYLKDQL